MYRCVRFALKQKLKGRIGMKKCLLFAATIVALLLPGMTWASEEKTVSLEAVMEELDSLKSLVIRQQRQIDELQTALKVTEVTTTPAATPRATAVVSLPAAAGFAQQGVASSNQ